MIKPHPDLLLKEKATNTQPSLFGDADTMGDFELLNRDIKSMW